MTKKILAVLLALAMVLSLVSVNVFAADEEMAYQWGNWSSTRIDIFENEQGVARYSTTVEDILAKYDKAEITVTVNKVTGTNGDSLDVSKFTADCVGSVTSKGWLSVPAASTAKNDNGKITVTVDLATLYADIIAAGTESTDKFNELKVAISAPGSAFPDEDQEGTLTLDRSDYKLAFVEKSAEGEGNEGGEETTGSYTFTATKTDWTEIMLADMTGFDMKPGEDATVTITCDNAEFKIGYNVTEAEGWWGETDMGKTCSLEMTKTRTPGEFDPTADKVSFNADEGKTYTFTWTVTKTSTGGEGDDGPVYTIPDGYEVIESIEVTEPFTFVEAEWEPGTPDYSVITFDNAKYGFQEDDYIIFSITPSESIKEDWYKLSLKVANTEGDSDWEGVDGSDFGNIVGCYLSEIISLNPKVPIDKLGYVAAQMFGIDIGDHLEGYTVTIARDASKINDCEDHTDYDATVVEGEIDEDECTFTPDSELTGYDLVHVVFDVPAAADGTVTVNYAEVKDPVQKPEGTEYALEKNQTYNWQYTYEWETLATVLKDIAPDDVLKYDDVEITLELGGAIADGELIDVTKINANLVVQTKWNGWLPVPDSDTVATADGIINIKGDFTKLKNETTDTTSRVISQIYIDPEDLPNGLEGTKEATIYVKSATIRIGGDTYSTKPTTPSKPAVETTEIGGTLVAGEGGGAISTTAALGGTIGYAELPKTYKKGDSIVVIVKGNATVAEGGKFNLRAYTINGFTDVATAEMVGKDMRNFDTIEKSGPFERIAQLNLTDTGDHLIFKRGADWNCGDVGDVTEFEITSVAIFEGTLEEYNAAAATPATVAVSEGVPVGASVPAPATATFKAGDPCVTVEVDPDLVIESIAIDGAKIAKIEVLTKKATKPTNPAIPGLPNVPGLGFGYPIQLGNEYHGFLLADGSMITMPHEFNANGFCTVCGYTVLNNSTPATDVTVDVPTEAPETQEDDTEGDDMNVSDEVETPKEDENPKTGLALAVLPMLAAAAVAAASRKH